MALGALIGAYQEDNRGGLRALLPLAGRTLVEYQARCAAAIGAAPIVVVVERIPQALDQAFARLRDEGIGVIAVSDAAEAVAHFQAGELVLLMSDGLVADVSLVRRVAGAGQPVIATVADDEDHERFERIDGDSRWAGLALVDSSLLAATAAMLGDWDLTSTLLRRMVQANAGRLPVEAGATPLLASEAGATAGFERRLLIASRGARIDWPSRYLLPPIEDLLTERLMESRVRPQWLIHASLLLTLAAAVAFARGWHWLAMVLLLVMTPLELVADRLASIRLQPLSSHMLERRLLWPATGLALLALGWWQWRHGGGSGAMVTALAAVAFAEAGRIERSGNRFNRDQWLFSPSGAVWALIPFAILGWWDEALAFVALYAAGSFFIVQHFRHGRRLTGR